MFIPEYPELKEESDKLLKELTIKFINSGIPDDTTVESLTEYIKTKER